MRKLNNKYIFILGLIVGLIFSITTAYAIDAYIESSKVTYTNHNKTNVEEAIDELYEKSGIHKEKWVDSVLNGNDPVLKTPLIPVEITDNGEVYYANENSEWYNYSKKKWANAVILIDNPSNKNYGVGDHIIESDIKGYFVWIPRYSYKIWNLGNYTTAPDGNTLTNKAYSTSTTKALNNARLIDIKFVSTDIKEEGSTVGSYLTHPAFKLGEKTLSGIWVGKFETGGTSEEDMVIKPNVTSWRNDTVKVYFTAGKNFASSLDSHMMKNTEWGAAAYLSHSKFGIKNEININNANDYKTGYSAAPNTDQSTYPGESGESSDGTITQPWNSEVGYFASTTGNISGIYDMSGGSHEYVAAYKQNSTSADKSGFSAAEITEQITAGYIDGYASNSTDTSYNKRILGDATGEMGPFYTYYDKNGSKYAHNSWYGDLSVFVGTYPWFLRSGGMENGILAGQFKFSGRSGANAADRSFRIVLTPIK